MYQKVKSQSDKLQKSDSNQQYLVFRPVKANDLIKVDRTRDSVRKHTRMTHYTDPDLLIVKLILSRGGMSERGQGARREPIS
jgi:hypothetical protein